MGGCEARPPYPPRDDRSDSDRSEGGCEARPPYPPRDDRSDTDRSEGGSEARPPYPPRDDRSDSDRSEGGCEARPPSPPRDDRSDSSGHSSGADAHFSMTRSLTSGFSFSRRSAGTVTVAASPSLTNRSCGCLSNHASHEARSRSRTWMRGRRIGSKPRANGERAAPPATMRIASCSYAVPLALPRSAHATSRG